MTTRSKIHHPLPAGTRIQTIGGAAQGDWDEEDSGDTTVLRMARPGEVGTITDRNFYHKGGWTYGVVFDECEAWVFLEEADVSNPAKYRILT